MTSKVYLNGKFYSGRLNGVHRVADRLIRELDKLLAGAGGVLDNLQIVLLVPRSANWRPTLQHISIIEEQYGHSQLWEQLILPLKYRDGLIVNLCNLAPILHPSTVLLLHDVQFLRSDSSYPLSQTLGYRLLVPWMTKSSSKVLAVSEFSRQMLHFTGICDQDRVSVLHNGSEHILEAKGRLSLLGDLDLSRGGFALHIASPKIYKNSKVVFEAFADSRLDGVRLVVVGPGESALRRAGLDPPASCTFAGAIDDEGLRTLYENAICLLFPSRTEGFGLPPVEAMRCGCPSVVAPAGAIPEVCRDAVAYADVDDPAGWATAIMRFRDDPAFREHKVRLGHERALAFDWGKAGRQLAVAIADAVKT